MIVVAENYILKCGKRGKIKMKKSVKKIVTLMLTMGVGLGCLAGCSSGEGAETAKEPAEGMTTVWRAARKSLNSDDYAQLIEISRNEYGLYTTHAVFEDGEALEELSNVSLGIEERDENGKLLSYKDRLMSISLNFQYDSEGKLEKIGVEDTDDNFTFGYSTREDARYMKSSGNEQIHYDENLNELYVEEIQRSRGVITDTEVKEKNIYDANGLLIQSDYIKAKDGLEYHEEFVYDENGKKIKETCYKAGELYTEKTYTYSEKGNLLTLIGLEYGQGLSPKGEEYLREEYTDAEYDEQGRCYYAYTYYDRDHKRSEKTKSDETWTYEYAEEGWLLKETCNKALTKSNGQFVRNEENYKIFDKDGNVVEASGDNWTYTFTYEPFEIVDDELLVAFYEYYGEELQ